MSAWMCTSRPEFGAAGHGGQILVSDTTHEAVRGRHLDLSFDDLGPYVLKGIPRPVRLYQVTEAGRQASFAPLRAKPISTFQVLQPIPKFASGREGLREGDI